MNRRKVRTLLRQIYDSSLIRKREVIHDNNTNLEFLNMMKNKSESILKELDSDSKEYLILSKTRQIYLESIYFIRTKPDSNTF